MRFIKLGAILAFFILAGCGGGGGSELPSPYAGSWAGIAGMETGSGTSSGLPSNIAMVVDTKGRLTGSWEDANGSGSFNGSVTRGGELTLNISSPGPPPVTISAKGVTAIAQGGNWQGSLPVTSDEGAGMSVVIDVVRQ